MNANFGTGFKQIRYNSKDDSWKKEFKTDFTDMGSFKNLLSGKILNINILSTPDMHIRSGTCMNQGVTAW